MSTILRRMFPAFPVAQLGPNPVNGRKAGLGGAPVGFSGRVSSLLPGGTGVVNAQTLQSGFRTPYLIDEIRIVAFTNDYNPRTVGPIVLQGYTGLAGLVKVKFQTGQYAFSKDAIPFGLYGPIFSQYDYGEAYFGQYGGGSFPGARAFASVRWMLPKPLLMPAGDVVQANVVLNDNALMLANSIQTDVIISYIGRLIAPGTTLPEKRYVPWASYMEMTASAGSTPGADFKNSSREYENPFMKDLHVQRFTSRTFTYRTSATNMGYTEEVSSYQHYSTAASYFETRIDDSLGYEIVKQFTPVGEVFDTSRHAWNFGRALSARQQFNVQLRTGLDGTAVPADTNYTQMVGIVGYREENV